MPDAKVEFTIDGMHCGNCSYKIQCEVEDLNGIKEAQVDHVKKIGVFTYDPSVIKPEDIKKKITELKFTVS